jgi:hypothetical protein
VYASDICQFRDSIKIENSPETTSLQKQVYGKKRKLMDKKLRE